MAFILARRLQPLRGLVDVVPIVTVVLLLLLFFILSSSFVLQPGIKVDPPHSAFAVGMPTSRLIVAVTLPPAQTNPDGSVLPREPVLYFDDQVSDARRIPRCAGSASLQPNFAESRDPGGQGCASESGHEDCRHRLGAASHRRHRSATLRGKMTTSVAPPGPRPVAHTLALLQPWIDFVPRQQRRLGLFICCALAVHAAAFFFIRIDATRAEIQRPNLTHLTMENSRPEAGAESSDSFLDRLADPRFFLQPAASLVRLSAVETSLPFSGINSSLGTDEKPAPAAAPDLTPASAPLLSLAQEVTATMNPARQVFTYDEKAPPPPAQTLWQWAPAFAARLPKEVPQLPSPVSDTDVSPSQLQVALAPDGTVEHALLENSSQNPELDQQAIFTVRRLRFRPAEGQGLTWGQVTVFWHTIAPPAEVVVPTPPSPQ